MSLTCLLSQKLPGYCQQVHPAKMYPIQNVSNTNAATETEDGLCCSQIHLMLAGVRYGLRHILARSSAAGQRPVLSICHTNGKYQCTTRIQTKNIYTDHLLTHWYRHAQPTRAKPFVPDEICNDVATTTNLTRF
jgi:hypothetical protein